MSFTSAFSKPYTLTRDDGESLAVPLLSMDQISAVIASLESRRNKTLRDTAKENKLSPEATANFIAIGEREEIELYHLRAHASSIKGANEMLAMTLKPEELGALSIAERIECARAAIGWSPEKKAGETSENPSIASGPSTGK